MSDQPAFAVDITAGNAILHVRGETWPAFAAALLDASKAFPLAIGSVGPDYTVLRHAAGAAYSDVPPGHKTGQDTPRQGGGFPDPDAAPECPEHGLASPSRYGGLYCPYQDEVTEAYCSWTFGKRSGRRNRAA